MSEPGNDREPRESAEADVSPAATAADIESDPARDDRPGGDWSDEGGATPSGAATSTSADDDA